MDAPVNPNDKDFDAVSDIKKIQSFLENRPLRVYQHPDLAPPSSPEPTTHPIIHFGKGFVVGISTATVLAIMAYYYFSNPKVTEDGHSD